MDRIFNYWNCQNLRLPLPTVEAIEINENNHIINRIKKAKERKISEDYDITYIDDMLFFHSFQSYESIKYKLYDEGIIRHVILYIIQSVAKVLIHIFC